LMFHWLAPNTPTFYSFSIPFATTCAFITFIAPLWFIRLQRYKNTIHGPWDEARLS
jgi:hypothetical protein